MLVCSNREETRDHLLLTCDFSVDIWKLVLVRLGPSQHMFRSWAELLSWTSLSSELAPSTLRKLAVQTTVYHLWKQRNNVLHYHLMIPAQTIFKSIDCDIRNSITARRLRKQFRNLMAL
ncbi:uncharacterized protein LOC112087613 [Eutrema salsugineum]|uniref:uncharacterized protein LOC112087613 n=1 Tax=Eutrema salsugineum TaxID=72664 RepID=UPI000CECE6CE|nr:uncharacterized protein LOC112087613 [Eutrema salsugineum]